MSEECDYVVQTDREDGAWGFMADDRVVIRTDYSVLCLDISGYVTAVNGRLVSGLTVFCRKKRHSVSWHKRCDNSRVYSTILFHCICNIRDLIMYTF